MIISGGMNIYPAEIEAALEQHPEHLRRGGVRHPRRRVGRVCARRRRCSSGRLAERRRRDGASRVSTSPTTRCRAACRSWKSCPALAPARSSSASCARRTGPDERHRSAEPRRRRGELTARGVDVGAAVCAHRRVHSERLQLIAERDHLRPRCAACRPARRRVQRDQVHVRPKRARDQAASSLASRVPIVHPVDERPLEREAAVASPRSTLGRRRPLRRAGSGG